jgi:hypothetical protein
MFSYIHTSVNGSTSRDIQMSTYELNFEVCCLTTLSTVAIIQRLSQIKEEGWRNGGMILTGKKPKYSEKSLSIATPFTTNPTPTGQRTEQ